MRPADQPHALQHVGANALTWLNPSQAATYVGVSVADFLPLVEAGQLTLHRAPDQSLRINRDDLDAVLQPVPPVEAARLLAAEVSITPSNPMTTNDLANQVASPSSTLVPLKDAAKQLRMPYKTLLRLVHAGDLPATNLSSSGRPRYVADPVVIRRIWDERAQRDMRKRSAPVAALDYSRLLSKGGKGVCHG